MGIFNSHDLFTFCKVAAWEIDEAQPMKRKTDNRLGIINSGNHKGSPCLIIDEYTYINTDRLKWFRILLNNNILVMSNKSITFL